MYKELTQDVYDRLFALMHESLNDVLAECIKRTDLELDDDELADLAADIATNLDNVREFMKD